MSRTSVCIDVLEMEKAIKFYTQALGCELTKENNEYTELSFDALKMYLIARENGTNPLIEGEAVRNYERHWTPIHLDFHVSNIKRCVASIIQLGGAKEGESSGDWGSAAFCADHFGNGFCLMEYSS